MAGIGDSMSWVSDFYTLLWPGSRCASGKVTVSGIANRRKLLCNLHSVCTVYNRGRGPRLGDPSCVLRPGRCVFSSNYTWTSNSFSGNVPSHIGKSWIKTLRCRRCDYLCARVFSVSAFESVGQVLFYEIC